MSSGVTKSLPAMAATAFALRQNKLGVRVVFSID
jgi:hypothetical protein